MKKIVALVLLTFFIFGLNNISSYAKTANNGMGNVANDGYAVSDGEYVYYSADGKLYREDIGGGNRKTILDDGSCSDIVIYGEYIYYSQFLTGGTLYRVKKDGQSDKESIAGCMTSPYTKIHKGYMYYISRNYAIRKRNLNNWDDYVDLGETYGNFIIDNGKIYFNNEDSDAGAKGLSSMNIDGSGFKSFLIGDINQIIGLHNGMLYYTANGYINRLDIQSGNEEQLIESSNSRANIYGDFLLFRSKNKKLTGLSLNGGVAQESGMDVYDTFCIVEDKVYTRSPDSYRKVKIYDLPQFSDGNNQDSNAGTTTTFGSHVSDWAKEDVEKAYRDGLIPETLVGTDLTQKINRSEFAAVAVLIYENLTPKSVSASATPFNDIASDPNKKSINKAYKLGITVGTSVNTFDPSRNITREELATMLCRGIKKYKFPDWTPDTDYMYYIQGTSGIKFEDDAEISDYAKNSVYFMSSAGIIKGIDSTHFAPKTSVTRGDALDYGMATREQAILMSKRIKENKSYFDYI